MTVKFGIIGTGAVGGYYGGLLCRYGYETHFLLHSDYDHVREKGLRVDSRDGDFHLRDISVYQRATDMPPCDIVLLALKTTANHVLADVLPPVVKPDGTVVVLQNGLGVEEQVGELLPGATILGGLCFLCSNKLGPGHIHHLDFGSIRIGEYRRDGSPAGLTPAVENVRALFQKAGITVSTTDNLGLARWQKLVWNMAYNGVTVVLAATTDQLMADAAALALVRSIMEEVCAGAGGYGYSLNNEFIEKMLATTAKMVAYSPSMKLDYEAGRPLEVETIYWRPIRAAHKKDVSMPRAETIAWQLEYLDSRNRRS